MLMKMQRKGNPLTLLVGVQAGTTTLENSMEVFQKVENRATQQLHYWVFALKIQM